MGSIAPGHFEEMSDSLLPSPSQQAPWLLHMHQDQQKTQLALFCASVFLPQDMSTLMNPSIDPSKRFPIGVWSLEGFFQKMLQAQKRFWKAPLFSATRAMEVLIWLRRSWSLRPEAARGGCPSSVMALRTAKQ